LQVGALGGCRVQGAGRQRGVAGGSARGPRGRWDGSWMSIKCNTVHIYCVMLRVHKVHTTCRAGGW